MAAVPDKLAIVTDEISLTYRALDLKASRIAAVLASLPSQRDRPIVLFMKDEAARIAAMLGALKANRIFIPLAPNSPEKWMTQVIENSGTAQIIVDSSTRSIAELAATGGVTVMEVEQLARSSEPFVADRTASPDDTAYIVYTSGSTGRPKGVANSHRSLIRPSDVRNRYSGSGAATGMQICAQVASPLGSATPCCRYFRGHACFRLISIATVYRSSRPGSSPKRLHTSRSQVRCCEPGLRRYPTIFGFRRSVSSGRRASGSTHKTLFASPGISKAIGASDIAIRRQNRGTIAAQVFTPSRLPDAGIVAVGRPVDGVEVCIKDETGALVPPGEIGEIVVRSRFLAQGYWNNPELTAKVFQTDPLDSAIRIYRTGDLGRWRSDGTLEHVGRKGRRIRLRGYNIEPFEVECELMRQPGVTDAVVLLHDGAAGQEPCLVGYVVAPANASPSAMRKGLAERLPSYMVPSHIVVLDSFPIASSGKIDRDALPPPTGKKRARWHSARHPTTASMSFLQFGKRF